MRKTFLAICLVLAGLQPAAAQPAKPPAMGPQTCYAAKLRNTSGMFLSLTNGLRFQVMPGPGRAEVTAWLPLDRLQVCRAGGSASRITNLSRAHAGTVMVLRLYN